MNLTSPPATPETARDLAVNIGTLAGPTPATDLQVAVTAGVGSTARVYFSPRSSSQPAFALADAGDWSFLFMEGASSLLQGTQTLAGYQGGVGDSWTAPTNDYFQQLRDNVLAAAAAQGFLGRPNVVCTGHSIGGAVACLVAGVVRDTQRQANIAYCTFGAPKPACWPALEATNRCVAARWFCNDDPVPLIIPTSADNLGMLVTFSVRENQRFSNFAQPFGGIQIGNDAQITPATYPETASVSAITAIGAWLFALDGQANTPHSLQTYISRLTGWVVAHPGMLGHPQNVNHTNDSGGETHRELTDSQRLALQALKQQEAAQHAERVNVPVSYKAQVVKLGKVWQVLYGENGLVTSSRKRSAFSFERKMNTFLQSVLKQGLVDPKAIGESVTAYLQAAKDPTSGIAPQLNDQLPPP